MKLCVRLSSLDWICGGRKERFDSDLYLVVFVERVGMPGLISHLHRLQLHRISCGEGEQDEGRKQAPANKRGVDDASETVDTGVLGDT